jgi:flavin-dependent dehydrogenase
MPPTDISKKGDLEKVLLDKLNESEKLKHLMSGARREREMYVSSNYGYEVSKLWGPRFLLSGDAAGFLDPIFSSGVHVSMQSAHFASECLSKALENQCTLDTEKLGAKFENQVRVGMNRFHGLISLFYKENYVSSMKQIFKREESREAFTSVTAGDVWNEKNPLFAMGVL